ncbi:MAG TPA: 50S ribosomal protein L33 [Candidatus Paceibacterota bacterium]
MAGKRKAYVKMQCTVCKRFNYFIHSSKRKTDAGEKLEMKKHCKHCKKHTNHKEAK